MAKPFSLQPVLDLMQSRTDDAARELGKRISQERDARSQLKVLEDYRQEYAARFNTAMSAGITLGELHNYQAFLARLDEAIGHQRKVVTNTQEQTAAGQQAWIDQRNRLKAMDALSDRHLDRERQIETRREQKLMDEHTARRFVPSGGE